MIQLINVNFLNTRDVEIIGKPPRLAAKDSCLWSSGRKFESYGGYFFIFQNTTIFMVKINSFRFGSLTINNKTYDTDMVVSWDGELIPRESSHTFSKEELMDMLVKGPEVILIGTGTAGCVKIDKDVEDLAQSKNVEIMAKKTADAVDEFNKASKKKKIVAMLHVTC
jgi:hypothetical protein